MRLCRFFCPQLQLPTVVLDPSESHHCADVLRKKVGESIELTDGQGALAQAVITAIAGKRVECKIMQHRKLTAPSRRLALAVSIPKGDRLDWMVEKCVELGVWHIALTRFEHTVKLGGDNMLQKARRIAVAALKQSGRLFLPVISGVEDLAQTIDRLKKEHPAAAVLYGQPAGRPFMASDFVQTQDVIFVIGPEGGFSDIECSFLAQQKADAVCINDGILRIETAAVAVCAAFGALAGIGR